MCTLMKKSARLRSALLRWLSQRLAAILNILRNAFQTLAGQLRPRGNLLDIRKRLGVVHLYSHFLQVWMNLGENEKHFAANAGLACSILAWLATSPAGRCRAAGHP